MAATIENLRTPFRQPIDTGMWFLRLTASALVIAGLGALWLGVSGRFLPHDERFLGMTAGDLCALHGCRIVHFMIHDRVSFGAAVLAIGLLYSWLIESPLRQGEAWAWWALVVSGTVGFASFFAYLCYGYLDTWHGLTTLMLLPCYAVGMIHSRPAQANRTRPAVRWPGRSAAGMGRVCLLATAAGMVCAGLTIMTVGMTSVFVPQDLAYMGLSVDELNALNPRLIPLIAHDRAGFGGAVASCGVALFFCVWFAVPSRRLWCMLGLVGLIGFGAAIGVHPAVGYDDAVHLAPAVIGALTYLTGLILTSGTMFGITRSCHDHAAAT